LTSKPAPSGHASEYAFLHACVTHDLFPGHSPPRPGADLDWNALGQLASAHRVEAVLYDLGSEHPGLWPGSFQEHLRTTRYLHLVRGEWSIIQARDVLTALADAGIPTMVLKGWAMIPLIYRGEPGRRTYADIDLLVPPACALHAEEVLRSLDYAGIAGQPHPGYRQRYNNAENYIRAGTAPPRGWVLSVGLHWHLLDLPYYIHRISIEELFDRSIPLDVAGMAVRGLAVEDHLIYAAAHLALNHGYDESLFHYYEAAGFILHAGPALDWSVVQACADAWHLVLPLQAFITHLHALWKETVPDRALEAILALEPSTAEKTIQRLVMGKRYNPAMRTIVSFLTLPGVGRRLRFLAETALPSPAYMEAQYGPAPGGFWPALYLRRLVAAIRHAIPL
jgi:hypothetical protein